MRASEHESKRARECEWRAGTCNRALWRDHRHRQKARYVGVVGEADDGLSEAVTAGPPENNTLGFAGGMGYRSDTGFSGELLFRGEAFPNVTELGQDFSSANATFTWKRHNDLSVRS